MKTKTKILITVLALLCAFGIGILIGVLNPEMSSKQLEIENPITLSYFADNEQTEQFSLQLPSEYRDSIMVSADKTSENMDRYIFSHVQSREVLFIIYVSRGDAYKDLTIKHMVIKETEKHTYVWAQSVADNSNIEDKNIREQFGEIARYYDAIRKSITVSQTT